MQKVLFIDRDGTLIKEAPPDYKVDSFEKLAFYPDVFFYLRKIATELDYLLVLITNQDGLGTPDFQEQDFWPVQNFVMQSFANEAIIFTEVLIDITTVEENKNTRKPNTGLLVKYLNNPEYDLKNSFVIGDRITDMQLAKNLNCKGLWLNNGSLLGKEEIKNAVEELLKTTVVLNDAGWKAIYNYLKTLD